MLATRLRHGVALFQAAQVHQPNGCHGFKADQRALFYAAEVATAHLAAEKAFTQRRLWAVGHVGGGLIDQIKASGQATGRRQHVALEAHAVTMAVVVLYLMLDLVRGDFKNGWRVAQ